MRSGIMEWANDPAVTDGGHHGQCDKPPEGEESWFCRKFDDYQFAIVKQEQEGY